MDFVNISKRQFYDGIISNFSSEESDANSIKNILIESGYWKSESSHEAKQEFFIIDFEKIIPFDYIEMLPAPVGVAAFPRSFRIEGSYDKSIWEVIHTEKNFDLDSNIYSLDLPLTQVQYLKLVILEPGSDSKYYSEIGRCSVGISGVSEIKAGSSLSSDSKVDNLTQENFEYCWESKVNASSSKESVFVDLGKIYHVNRIVLGSADAGFPENFHVEISTDNNIWAHLFEETNFKEEKRSKYYWNIDIVPVRFLRLEMIGVELGQDQFGNKISLFEISAAPYNRLHTHNIGELTPYASVFQAGIARLSKDGEEIPGTVVQGNDSRLRDATTIFKGIIQLAEDNDTIEGTVVQASDSRLKTATELNPGIVRLSYDRENKPGTVVQSNDSRLQEATDDSFGTVKLCPDGQYSMKTVVTGNDSRLQSATVETSGICQLAKNGGEEQNTVVQGNDKRLRKATTVTTGIVELAEDGENNTGVVVQGNDQRLKDATTQRKGIVEFAEDGENAQFVAVQGNDKRLKEATFDTKGIAKFAKDGENAPFVAVQGNDKRLKDASIEIKGIVQLAKDGENGANLAVQGNDRRLKDSTETSKGILRFATDGEVTSMAAVQGSDKRLRDATTLYKGIVELAEDGEDAPFVAVQGNDQRLKIATTKYNGIVELAENGEDRSNVVVQGNDDRLKDATENSKGIAQFAENEEVVPFKMVQANDNRLRTATTMYKGIVELAEDGEENAGVVVQGNDKRIKKATTTNIGIVELAEDGEDAPEVVVQGNDRRLKAATIKNTGIVSFAKNNEKRSNYAVQADDERLFNARPPLEHDHNYSPENHGFNSHTGTLSISGSKHETFNEITPPSDNSSVIHGVNTSKEKGSIGITGIAGALEENSISYGVVGHSKHIGVRGQSSGGENSKGCGVLGISRFGSGGVFSSEHGYSVIADGYGDIQSIDNSIKLFGNGDALAVNGKSDFNGPIFIKNKHTEKESNYPVNIVEKFEVDEEEFISPGDLLVVSETGGSLLTRSKVEYNKSVIGVVSGNPSIIINNSGKEEKIYPIALTGKVMCKVDARYNPINPGDLIVTSNTPGCGMVGEIDNFNKIGTVIGKALDKFEEGTGVIPVFISHM